MALEDLTGASKFIDDLVKTNPVGATDYGSTVDDHIRGIKNVLLNTFPNITGAVNATQAELNALASGAAWVNTFLQSADVKTALDNLGFPSLTGAEGKIPAVNSGETGFDFVAPEPPAGSVFDYAGSTLPSGYLWCDGSEISRTTYADLFTAIGTTYGVGDGSTTFDLPDLRGRVTVGKDNMDNAVGTGGGDAARVTSGGSGVDGDTLGATGGDELLQAHTHTGALSSSTSAEGGANSRTYNQTRVATGSTGGGSGENMPPAIVLNKIIKT